MYDRYGESDRSTKVDVGETHVAVCESSGRVLVVCILERLTDVKGQITSPLLDRIVHQRYGKIEGWQASGCFVTELVPRKASE